MQIITVERPAKTGIGSFTNSKSILQICGKHIVVIILYVLDSLVLTSLFCLHGVVANWSAKFYRYPNDQKINET